MLRVTLREHGNALLVSGEALWLGLGIAVFMAGVGVLSDLVGHAASGRHTPDAQAAVSVHHGIGGHDGPICCDLLPQGGATLGWIQKVSVVQR
jgi:hypothetical protein